MLKIDEVKNIFSFRYNSQMPELNFTLIYGKSFIVLAYPVEVISLEVFPMLVILANLIENWDLT